MAQNFAVSTIRQGSEWGQSKTAFPVSWSLGWNVHHRNILQNTCRGSWYLCYYCQVCKLVGIGAYLYVSTWEVEEATASGKQIQEVKAKVETKNIFSIVFITKERQAGAESL